MMTNSFVPRYSITKTAQDSGTNRAQANPYDTDFFSQIYSLQRERRYNEKYVMVLLEHEHEH